MTNNIVNELQTIELDRWSTSNADWLWSLGPKDDHLWEKLAAIRLLIYLELQQERQEKENFHD